ncbi:hypothetical protein PNOK_0926000 [Pyrrhoderma noxium]|uniref:DUF6699 domain-containing protein n=1 Tax=Pyrrhoderma noxium TaxID=2282107 RepID=A0A286U7E1_9AGAM|nr:hypothetical protein PNOK_0926000 [Pyrrhoderma noxium]
MLIAQPMAFPVYVDNKESFGANYNRRYPSPPLDDFVPNRWAEWKESIRERESIPRPEHAQHQYRHRTVSQAVPGTPYYQTPYYQTQAQQEDYYPRSRLESVPVPEWVRNGKGPVPKVGPKPPSRPPSRKGDESEHYRQETNYHPTTSEMRTRARANSSAAFYAQRLPPDQDTRKAHKLIQYGSKRLIRYDMRLPYTSVKKTTDTGHPTYLKYSDLTSAAFEPYCKEAFIRTSAIRDLSFKVVAKNGECIIIQDVLDAIQRSLCGKIDVKRYMLDSINPKVYKATTTAFEKRIELYADRVDMNLVRQGGLQNVDQLGENYMFIGLAPLRTNDDRNWWMLYVDVEDESEPKPEVKPTSRLKKLFSTSKP